MKNDPIYKNLKKRHSEIAVVSPQTLGPLTHIYKRATSWVKTWPVRIIVPLAFIGGVAFQLLFGEGIVRVVSVLQRGF